MLFARNLEYGREGCRVGVDSVSDLVCNVLVDQNDADVLALCSKRVKGGLDCGCICLVVDNQEVLLGVWGVGDVLKVSRR